MTSHLTKKSPARTYGGLSESERIIERRERFLDAGLEVFGTVGLRGATVRILCRTAGLTERYFYESFADMEALFCAVYEKQSAAFYTIFVAEMPRLPDDMESRIHASLDIYFTVMRNDRVVRVLLVEPMAGSERVAAMHHASIRRYADFAAMLIRTDNPDLTLPDEFAPSVALAINGACTSLTVQWMLDGYATPQDILVKSCAMVVLGTMRSLRDLPRTPA